MKKIIFVLLIAVLASCKKETIDPKPEVLGSHGRGVDHYIYSDPDQKPR